MWCLNLYSVLQASFITCLLMEKVCSVITVMTYYRLFCFKMVLCKLGLLRLQTTSCSVILQIPKSNWIYFLFLFHWLKKKKKEETPSRKDIWRLNQHLSHWCFSFILTTNEISCSRKNLRCNLSQNPAVIFVSLNDSPSQAKLSETV